MKLILRVNFIIILINIFALILAITGNFSLITVLTSIVISMLIGLVYPSKVKWSFSKKTIIPVALILGYSLFIGLFNHETYFGGRDNGVYANSALSIAKTGSYRIQNDLIGSYPGFIETVPHTYQPAFYLGYTSWLAIFIKIWGYQSIVLANIPLIFFGLINLYLIFKKISNTNPYLPLIVAMTTFPFLWFTRSTYSENLAFMLFMFIINSLYSRQITYLIAASALLLCVRIESIPLAAILILFFCITKRSQLLRLNYKYWFSIILSLCLVLIYYAYADNHYLLQLIRYSKNIIGNITTNGVISSTSLVVNNVKEKLPPESLEYHTPEITIWLLSKYNFYYFAFIIPALILAIRNFKSFNKSKRVLALLLIIAPQLYYLLNPMVVFDQPWFLRRFYPLLIPTTIAIFYYCISRVLSYKNILLVTIGLVVVNISISYPILAFSENKGIYNQLEKFDRMPVNKVKDLILVDYDNIGNFKLAEPLYFINNFSTLVTNSQSLADYKSNYSTQTPGLYGDKSFRVPRSVCRYSEIYTLTSPESKYNQIISSEDLSPVWTITINYKQLKRECELFRITPNKAFHEMAHLKTSDVMEYCKNLPKTINDENIKVALYKIKKTDSDSFFKCQT